jgi:predicted dithiol-disulfide oxidoreductase (DUF899 family)
MTNTIPERGGRAVDYREASARLNEYRREIAATRAKMRALQKQTLPEPVRDHSFGTNDGEVRLSQLFGAREDLFVIHNMGASCPYCTLWADGYNGTYEHLANRAAFVVASPDPPEAQRKLAEKRGWRFRMVSDTDRRFAEAMGYLDEGALLPGVSVFRKRNGGIVRVSDARFSPGDDFCSLWHFFDLIPEGRDGWAPRFSYPAKVSTKP